MDNEATPRDVAPPDGGATARARRWTGFALRLAAATYCWTMLWLFVWTLLPQLLGWNSVVITSGSMSPRIRVGDVVVVEPGVEITDLAPGQVIAFTDPVNGKLTTHRVDAISGAAVTTKGDANAIVDTTPVNAQALQGRARIVVPYVGIPSVWVAQQRYLELTVWAGLTLIAAWLALSTQEPSVAHHRERWSMRIPHLVPGRRCLIGGTSFILCSALIIAPVIRPPSVPIQARELITVLVVAFFTVLLAVEGYARLARGANPEDAALSGSSL